MTALVDAKRLGYFGITSSTCLTCPSSDPAQDAYNEAVIVFSALLTNDEQKRLWAGNYASIEDVQSAVTAAKKKYESKHADSKVRIWLNKLSSRILFYSSVLDVLASHHPEYTALAWGSIKLLLRTVLNHEDLLARIAKALAEIADVLPRLQLQSSLYANDAMKHAVSMVYANMIKFFHRAMVWYSAPRIERMVGAILRPYELRFKDVVDEIARCSRNVDQLAFTCSQVELRQMHQEQHELLQIVRDTRKTIIEHQTLNFRGFLDSNRRLCEIQFSQILTATALTSLPPPDRVFRQSKFLSARRRLERAGNDDRLWWQSRKLREWAASTDSSLLLVQASSLRRVELKDFSVDLVDLLLGLRVPVVWVLAPTLKVDETFTTVNILRQLVYQILQRNHNLMDKQSSALNPARFQSAVTQHQWLELLIEVLVGIRQLYIVLDGNLLDSQLENEIVWPLALRNMVETLKVKCPETAVKVLLTTHTMPNEVGSSALEALQDFVLRLQNSRRNETPRSRHRTGSHNSRLLRPFISQSFGALRQTQPPSSCIEEVSVAQEV